MSEILRQRVPVLLAWDLMSVILRQKAYVLLAGKSSVRDPAAEGIIAVGRGIECIED